MRKAKEGRQMDRVISHLISSFLPVLFFCHNNTTVDHQTIIRIVVGFLVSNDDITQRSGIYSSLSIQAHWHTGMITDQKELFLVRNPDEIELSLWQLTPLEIEWQSKLILLKKQWQN